MTSPSPPQGRHGRPLKGAGLKAAIESITSHPIAWLFWVSCTVLLGCLGVWANANQVFGLPTPAAATTPPAVQSSTFPPAAATMTPATVTPMPTQTQESFKVAGNGHYCPPSNPSDFKLPDVEICVVMWCQSATFELDGTPQKNQTQIKIKARIVNNSTMPMDISIGNASAMRLLVSESNLPRSWSPPPLTAAAGDQPILVEWSGSGSKQNYWALPPNVYADSYPMAGGVVTGFYTQWDPPILGPGESFYKPRPQVLDPQNTEGNLVFQIPVGSEVYGLAVVDKSNPTKLFGVSPYSDWKDRMVSPSYF